MEFDILISIKFKRFYRIMIMPDKIIRSYRRSMALIISDTGELVVRAPMRLSYDKIYSFIKEKEKWIQSKQKEVETKNLINIDIMTNKNILFLGTKYQITYLDGIKKIELAEKKVLIPTNFNTSTTKLKQWFIKHAKKILIERLEFFANVMQLDYASVSICNSKTRWGSCDSNRNIKLNFRLIMLPHKTLDYVLVHELSHILQMNHSKEFYKIISTIIPSYKLHQKILKENNYLLGLYR